MNEDTFIIEPGEANRKTYHRVKVSRRPYSGEVVLSIGPYVAVEIKDGTPGEIKFLTKRMSCTEFHVTCTCNSED